MSAQEILKMIVNVDLSSAKSRHDVNLEVMKHLFPDYEFKIQDGLLISKDEKIHYMPDFLNSLDCLKSIRPSGWYPRLFAYPDLVEVHLDKLPSPPEERISVMGIGKTEESALLEAIVKAIEFERGQK